MKLILKIPVIAIALSLSGILQSEAKDIGKKAEAQQADSIEIDIPQAAEAQQIETAQPTVTQPPPQSRPASRVDDTPTMLREWAPVKVEHNLGIRGGYGIGSIRLEPTRNNRPYAGLVNIGITYRFDVPAQKYVGAITAELNWMQQGFAYETYSESGEVYSREFSVIQLPIMWQPYLPLSKGGSRFHLNAGPYLSYMIDAGEYHIYTDDSEKETIERGNHYFNSLRDNRFGYGIAFGAGLFLAVKRIGITMDFRYNIGLSDILKGVTKYEGNPFRSPVDQINFSLGVNYKLGKKLAL